MEEFKNRLRYAMDVRGIRAIDLAKKIGVSRSAISQYLSGYAEPKTDKIYLLARALSVQESWLLGFDVPMEREPKEISTESKEILSLYEKADEQTREMVRRILNYRG